MGQVSLPAGSLVYLDTSVVIYSVERVPRFVTALDDFWEAVRRRELAVATSELTLLEALTKPLRDGNHAAEQAYESLLLGSELALLPVSRTAFRAAARLRAEPGLRTPDAIHAAVALTEGCTHLLTNDTHFRRVSGLEVLLLQDFVAK